MGHKAWTTQHNPASVLHMGTIDSQYNDFNVFLLFGRDFTSVQFFLWSKFNHNWHFHYIFPQNIIADLKQY